MVEVFVDDGVEVVGGMILKCYVCFYLMIGDVNIYESFFFEVWVEIWCYFV